MRPYIFQLPEFLPWGIGGRPIFAFGVTLAVAFLVGISLTLTLAERDGLDRKLCSNGLFVMLVSSLLGARLAYFLTATTQPLTFGNFIKYGDGGLVAYGGYIAGVLGLWGYMKWKKAPFWTFIDHVAPSVALGFGIGRIGCFLYGCDYGVKTNSWMGVRFPMWDDPGVLPWIRGNSPAFDDQLSELGSAAIASHSVLPTQLMASLAGFALFGVLLFFRRYRRFDGQVILLFFMAYSIFRFLIEFVRGDTSRGVGWFGTPFSTSQLIAISLLLCSAAIWVYLVRQNRPKTTLA